MISFKDKIKNIIDNKKSVSLRFLSLQEQNHLKNMPEVRLYGGYKDAELKRAYFYTDKLDDIVCYKINYNDKYLTLTHQNILGTLLSLSITRDSIGDILPKQGVFFTTKEIKDEIINSFTKINNVSIELEVISSDKITSEKEFEEYRTTVDSLRLDLVVSKICHISRKSANDLLNKELIKVNQQVITKATYLLKDNDILSIRKYGRFLIGNTAKRSKKGKIVLIYLKYI